MKALRILFMAAMFSLCFPHNVGATEGAEVFDIRKGEVIATIPNSALLQDQARMWLSSVNGIAGAVQIEPNDGIAIKVMLTPPQEIHNLWITGTATEVVVFIGKEQNYKPTLLVFTKENRLIAFLMKDGMLENFLKQNNLYSPDLNVGNVH